MLSVNIEKLKKSLTWEESIALMGNHIYVTSFKNRFQTERYYLVGYTLELSDNDKDMVMELIVEDDEKALKHIDFKSVLVFKTEESVFIKKSTIIEIESLADLKNYIKQKWYETYSEFQILSDSNNVYLSDKDFEKTLVCSGKLLLINDICNDLGIEVVEIGEK